ncbi:FecR family protein [Acetobacter sp. LMG 32666]|uniref:FecR family protein n=1 Tax=Acetobacter sp. LMG 32666 TaxID=2959295 RepID=UPI0030C7CDD0
MRNNSQDDLEAEAAEWVIRLGGGAPTPAERQAFAAWRALSPQHNMAFQRASRLWGDLDLGGREKQARRRRVITHAATGCMAGLFVLGVGFGSGWIEPARWWADYTTETGEIRTVRFEDGSSAVLNSYAALTIRYTARERRVVLLDGEAYFTVAPVLGRESRPFVVEAAGGASTALGTQFMVTRDGANVDTTVTEHSVRVAATGHGGLPQSIIVREGQKVHYGQDGLTVPQNAPVAVLTAWRNGQIVFDNEPLSSVIGRLNRYRHGRIVLANRTLADRRVSGVFTCSDVERALATISQELRVKSVSIGHLVTVIY